MTDKSMGAFFASPDPELLLFMKECIDLGARGSDLPTPPIESPDDYAEALKRADTLNGLPSKERVRRHPRCLCEKAAAIIALRQIDCVYESLFGGLTKVDDSDSGFQFERRNYTLPGQREYVVSRPFVRMVVPDSHVGQVRTVSVPSDRLKMHVRNVGNPGEIPEAVSVGVQLDKQVWVKETEIELAGVDDLHHRIDSALAEAEKLPRHQAETHLKAEAESLNSSGKEGYSQFMSIIDTLFGDPAATATHPTLLRSTREGLCDSLIFGKSIRANLEECLGDQDLVGHWNDRDFTVRRQLARFKSSETQLEKADSAVESLRTFASGVRERDDLYESEEPRPSQAVIQQATSILTETRYPGSAVEEGHVSTFFGEVNVTWMHDNRLVRLICFSSEDENPKVFHQDFSGGGLGTYGIEPGTAENLFSSLAWLEHPQ